MARCMVWCALVLEVHLSIAVRGPTGKTDATSIVVYRPVIPLHSHTPTRDLKYHTTPKLTLNAQPFMPASHESGHCLMDAICNPICGVFARLLDA